MLKLRKAFCVWCCQRMYLKYMPKSGKAFCVWSCHCMPEQYRIWTRLDKNTQKKEEGKTKTKSKPTHELYLLNNCKISKWPDCVNAQIKAIIKWSLKDLLFVTPEKNNSKNSAKVFRYGWKARRMITDHCTDSHNFHAHQKQETDKIKRKVQQIWFGPLSRWYVWLRCKQNGYK